MAQNTFTVGLKVRVSGTAKVGTTATDPTITRFKFRKSETGTVTTYVYITDAQLVRDSAGAFHVDLSLDTPGVWYYRWEGTGTCEAALEGAFSVINSNFD